MYYENGFLIGKYYPFHFGHCYLIEESKKRCKNLTVIVCTLLEDKEPLISGKQMYKIMKEYFAAHKNITIKLHEGDEPQYPEEHPRFWNIWLKIVLKHINPYTNDVIFSSEKYGDKFGELLGIKHECIDLHREAINICATDIRNDLQKNWDFLPQETKRYFIKRVALMGPESCWKSTLTKMLAKHFDCEYIEEYGREYVANNELTQHSFKEIVRTHNARLRNVIETTNHPLILLDTEHITTKVFYDLYFPTNQILDLDKLKTNRIDYRLVLYPDNDGIQDGTRDNLHRRKEHFDMIIARLKKEKVPYKIVFGKTLEEKFEQCKQIIQALLIL